MPNVTLGEIMRLDRPPLSATAATVSINRQDHADRATILNRAAGMTVTLPKATGSGSIFQFIVGTTFTGNGIIQVANAVDIIQGSANIGATASGTFPSTSTSDTLTMNGTTTGGLAGSRIEVVDIASGVFAVTAHLVGSGTAVTPFSAAV